MLHHNFVSVLLNDLYGIQARGGCACAGPYAQDLLGINETTAKRFSWFLESHDQEDVEVSCKKPLEIMKPGFVRVNLPFFMDEETVDFVLEAVDVVATHGWKLLPQYRFDPHTGSWEHRDFNKDKIRRVFSLHDVSYDEIGGIISAAAPTDYDVTLEEIAQSAKRTLENAVELNKEINTWHDETVEFLDDKNQLIWFLQPNEAQFYLAAETLVHKPKAPLVRTKLPFRPQTPSRMNRRRKWPDLNQIQAYLRRKKEAKIEDVHERTDENGNVPSIKKRDAWTLPTQSSLRQMTERKKAKNRQSCATQ